METSGGRASCGDQRQATKPPTVAELASLWADCEVPADVIRTMASSYPVRAPGESAPNHIRRHAVNPRCGQPFGIAAREGFG